MRKLFFWFPVHNCVQIHPSCVICVLFDTLNNLESTMQPRGPPGSMPPGQPGQHQYPPPTGFMPPPPGGMMYPPPHMQFPMPMQYPGKIHCCCCLLVYLFFTFFGPSCCRPFSLSFDCLPLSISLPRCNLRRSSYGHANARPSSAHAAVSPSHDHARDAGTRPTTW